MSADDAEPGVVDLRAIPDDRAKLLRLLADAEQRLSHIPDLQLRIGELEDELAIARDEAWKARAELAQLDTTWMYLRRLLRCVRPYIGVLKRARRALRRQ